MKRLFQRLEGPTQGRQSPPPTAAPTSGPSDLASSKDFIGKVFVVNKHVVVVEDIVAEGNNQY